jgi:hypothetical protein
MQNMLFAYEYSIIGLNMALHEAVRENFTRLPKGTTNQFPCPDYMQGPIDSCIDIHRCGSSCVHAMAAHATFRQLNPDAPAATNTEHGLETRTSSGSSLRLNNGLVTITKAG